MVRSAEEFCRQYGELHQIAVKILRVPYLYSGTYEEDYFFKLFSTVINKKQITFEEAPAQEMHFLALSDLGDLLYKIFDNWGEGSACLQVPQVFHFYFSTVRGETGTDVSGCKHYLFVRGADPGWDI